MIRGSLPDERAYFQAPLGKRAAIRYCREHPAFLVEGYPLAASRAPVDRGIEHGFKIGQPAQRRLTQIKAGAARRAPARAAPQERSASRPR